MVTTNTILYIRPYNRDIRISCHIHIITSKSTISNISRYLVICYPMKAKYISTVSRARYIIMAVWIAAMSFAVLPAYYVVHDVSGNVFLQ